MDIPTVLLETGKKKMQWDVYGRYIRWRKLILRSEAVPGGSTDTGWAMFSLPEAHSISSATGAQSDGGGSRASGTAAPGQLSGRGVLRTELQVVVIIQT